MKVRVHIRRWSRAALRRSAHALELGFFIAGCGALAISAWAFLEGNWFQATEIARFENGSFDSSARADLSLKLNTALPALEGRPPRGAAFSKIEIPRLGISAVVVEGVEPRQLKLAVGHVPGTAFPGEPGNVAIAAHRDTFFRSLRDIRAQDRITLTTLRGLYEYSVESTAIVGPTAVEILAPTATPELTLVTCYPFSYIGFAPQRFIVRARQKSSVSFTWR